ncbi:MAG: cysteine desulfurase family protein [Candidatus Kryptoniota bacterium]
MKKIYLDFAATTPVDERVLLAMQPYWSVTFGNPSSIHSVGREAKVAVERSRARLASLLGIKDSEFYFTSGGTESDNSAIMGVVKFGLKQNRNHLIVSSIEHHAVLHTARWLNENGLHVTYIEPDSMGIIAPERLIDAITEKTFLVSIIHTNNETGVIQDIKLLAKIAHEYGALFHTDAVQSLGKIPLNLAELDVDMATITAHKIYGPKGVGGLFIRSSLEWEPFLHGGSQERNRRPGTESVSLISGFATAVEIAVNELNQEQQRLKKLNAMARKFLEENVPGILFNSNQEKSIPNILNVSIDNSKIAIDGEALILNMDIEGIAVSSGSACSSGSMQPSHVIKALGRDDPTTMATVRFSFGRYTSEEEVTYAMKKFAEIVKKIGKPVKVSVPVS